MVQLDRDVRFVPISIKVQCSKLKGRLGWAAFQHTGPVGLYFNAVETDWNVVFRLVPRACTIALSPVRLAEEFEDRPHDPAATAAITTMPRSS
jgi:hypothetical protein